MAESLPNSTIYSAETAQTGVMRMRVDKPPFDDIRVRRAVQACCDVDAYPSLVFGGRAQFAEHHHVAQIHPEYFELPKPVRDVEKAKRLLAEAGYANGLDLSIDVGNTSGPWQQQCCEILKEQCAEAGINLSLNVMPSSRYWEIWTETPFGLTEWTHRPLGTMVLSLGYRSGVPWNESGYANPEFDAALDEAEAIVDPVERSKVMEKVQRILRGGRRHGAADVDIQAVHRPRHGEKHERAPDAVPPVPQGVARRLTRATRTGPSRTGPRLNVVMTRTGSPGSGPGSRPGATGLNRREHPRLC
ncbi:MAG: ABC transporter substrate-binding protein [Gammaproteobacteria bacterium]|nr:ABC transporter substrate-binding protein [Gammaproteobacteria bacterium]